MRARAADRRAPRAVGSGEATGAPAEAAHAAAAGAGHRGDPRAQGVSLAPRRSRARRSLAPAGIRSRPTAGGRFAISGALDLETGGGPAPPTPPLDDHLDSDKDHQSQSQ